MTTTAVPIPASVKDNSETVIDYAFMRHLSPDKGVVSPHFRDTNLRAYRDYLAANYTTYSWRDVNPNGQRCRFDMVIRNITGNVVSLMHTEYWTRVGCEYGKTAVWECSSYAVHYVQRMRNGEPAGDPIPLCSEDLGFEQRASRGESEPALLLSERLLVGQHD